MVKVSEAPAWPFGIGATVEQARRFDWGGTPLGPVDGWPPELRLAASLVLDNALPAALVWAARHATTLTLLMLLASLALLAVSCALLKHYEWGRIGFIVFLIVVALANFALLPLVDGMFDAMQAIVPADFLSSPEARDMRIQLQASRWVSLLTVVGTALVFAALHGWLVF